MLGYCSKNDTFDLLAMRKCGSEAKCFSKALASFSADFAISLCLVEDGTLIVCVTVLSIFVDSCLLKRLCFCLFLLMFCWVG